jgi:hypothetical protein
MARLWLLRPVSGWTPWYDKAFGFVIEADTEPEARAEASLQHGDEGAAVWLSEASTTCVELPTGTSGVILRDFWSA